MRLALATLLVNGVALLPRSARAETPEMPSTDYRLGAAERARLLHGQRVERPLEAVGLEGHYVGGLSYVLVRASVAEALAVLSDPLKLAKVLPRTRRVTLLWRSGLDARVELEQGTSLIRAVYSVRLTYELRAGVLRFWLDGSRPHDIDDLFGFFRVTRFDSERTLVTLAAMVDVGDGLSRLFERSVEHAILKTPGRLRDAIEKRLRRSERATAAPSPAAGR